MTEETHEICEACGQELGHAGPGAEGMTPPPNPYRDEPRTRLEYNLRQHVDVLNKITGQVDELLELARSGASDNKQLLEELESLRQDLKPRHGLCIDPHCSACRVHEEVIKEHVLLYVDWKVPGTIVALEQTRHRN